MRQNRREFVRMAAATAAALGLPWPSWADGEVRELRGGVRLWVDSGGTMAWYPSPEGVVVVDSQFPENASAFLRALGDHRPAAGEGGWLVNTHHHADHTGGNGTLKPRVDAIVAHSAVPELQRRHFAAREMELPPTVPTELFDSEWRREIGGEAVVATHFGPAHTGGDATVLFEKAGVVHVGDLVFNGVHPFVDADGGASIRGWITALQKIVDRFGDEIVYVFGHGAPELGVVGGATDLLRQRSYFEALLDRAADATAAGKSAAAAAAEGELEGFEGWLTWGERLSLEANLRVAMTEIAPS